MKCLVVGCGLVGEAFSVWARENGIDVLATTRSVEKAKRLTARKIQTVTLDWLSQDDWPDISGMDWIAISVSHTPIPGIDPTQTHRLGLQRLFQRITPPAAVTLYLSTTGVMVDDGLGGWIDEESPVGPKRPGAIAAWAAEQWLTKRFPTQTCVLRLAGIYGNGRIPNLEKLRSGIPIMADGTSYLNLVHVQDVARIMLKALQTESRSPLYLVSDGNPVLRSQYYAQLCAAMGISCPALVGVGTQEGEFPRRGSGNKRVSNRKLTRELDYSFLYPSYREGLLLDLQAQSG